MKRLLILASIAIAGLLSVSSCKSGSVVLLEDERTYTLSNGIVCAVVAKESGDLVSYKYMGKEMLATRVDENGNPDLNLDPPGANPNGLNRGMTDHQYGFWSHDAMGPRGTRDAVATVTIDPAKTRGTRAEVSIKGISEGRKMGTGPGSRPDGQFAADIDIRFAIEDGESKVYTYCIFTHPESYPSTEIGEARFCSKLAPMFDWMSVDEKVNFHYPADYYAGDKYVYTATQSTNTTFGWSSTTENIGFYVLNPSMEYMSGGPTKVEFMGHRDTNSAAAPCVLNYWRSSHYGGAEVKVAEGEYWDKVIGPFVLYVNSGADTQGLYADAKAQAKIEKAKWPYSWVKAEAYAPARKRSEVSGKLVLNDPHGPKEFTVLNVGLAAPDMFWQRDAKNYQFWALGNADGSFVIPNVREGKYTLYAFADGVLGEYVKTDIEVKAGKTVLGDLEWTPVRKGEPIFEIGVPNRNGSEFVLGDQFRDPEVAIKYSEMFPNDINYVVGKSDWSKDWPYLHVPHTSRADVKVMPFFGIIGEGKATPYTISFDMLNAPAAGKTATLRLAICGTAAQKLNFSLNGSELGELALKRTGDGPIARHGQHGIWYETEFSFDASKIVAGTNKLVITLPASAMNNGILYDYLRLEI